jgi:hypothetical protein
MRLLCDEKKKKKKRVTRKRVTVYIDTRKKNVAKQLMYKREEGNKKVFLHV